jgi:hypothetical protein
MGGNQAATSGGGLYNAGTVMGGCATTYNPANYAPEWVVDSYVGYTCL